MVHDYGRISQQVATVTVIFLDDVISMVSHFFISKVISHHYTF